jgi:hypothetical protein
MKWAQGDQKMQGVAVSLLLFGVCAPGLGLFALAPRKGAQRLGALVAITGFVGAVFVVLL